MSEFLLLVVLFISVYITGIFAGDHVASKPYNKLLAECQKELPRNQVCELYAKPKEMK